MFEDFMILDIDLGSSRSLIDRRSRYAGTTWRNMVGVSMDSDYRGSDLCRDWIVWGMLSFSELYSTLSIYLRSKPNASIM